MIARFTEEAPRLRRLAYAMLGEVSLAEDVVQESYLRFAAHEPTIEDAAAWLTTTVTRLSLDALKSARARRETYMGPWLPEPVEDTTEPIFGRDISYSLLVLLESLSPRERAVFLLREVFDVPYTHIATILEMSEAAARQLLHRAMEALRARKRQFVVTPESHQALLAAFVAATTMGDTNALEALLARDVTATSDGGGKRSAALRVVHGVRDVARFLVGLARKQPEGATARVASVMGAPALVITAQGEVESLVMLTADEAGQIGDVLMIRNPDKLRGVHAREPWA
jgi:RNA polymerase sigma-70 factor (ECF subfamily)